ncbi:MAG: hypothetical protein V4463_02015 [Pseudomonadota bacterium]
MNLPSQLLRARFVLERFGPVASIALALAVLGGAALAWMLPQGALQQQRQAVALKVAAIPAAARPVPVSANDNLKLFYASLGEKRYAEQQVKTLFGLAAKAGLSLSQGEYKSAYDANGKFTTYQVTLPVKGSYRSIWQFALLSLSSIPFAALDDISFKRETITDTQVEARLRLTIYLGEGGQP